MNRRRIVCFAMLLHATNGLPQERLLGIVKARKGYSPHYRATDLRHLVSNAPLAVTRGRPFAERRRRVRRHYGV